MRKKRMHTTFWQENEKQKFEGVGVDGRIILKWTLKKRDGRVWAGFI
jgi:hypothetical protein